jgi:quinoprotein glucose dehydrogenase
MLKSSVPKLVIATGLIVLLLGLGIGGLCAWLVILGGAGYYLAAGLALVISGALIAQGQAVGAWLYAIILLGTIAWAIGEAGLDGWALIPRLIAPAVLGLWIWSPWIAGDLLRGKGASARSALGFSTAGMITCAAVIVLVFAAGYRIAAERHLHFADAATARAAAASTPDTLVLRSAGTSRRFITISGTSIFLQDPRWSTYPVRAASPRPRLS